MTSTAPAVEVDMTGPQPAWPPAARALWRAGMARESRAPDAWHTKGRQGDAGLREVLAGLLGDRPEHIVVTAGVRSAAGLLGHATDRVLHERPSFDGTVEVFRSLRRPVELLSWNDFGAAGGTPGRTLAWLTHPARNPDGACLGPAQWAALDALAATGVRVVVNEVYRWHVPDRPVGSRYPPTVVGTLSKLAGTGAALGWIRAPNARSLTGYHPSKPPTLWQRCWRYVLERGGLDLFERESVEPARRAARRFFATLGVPGPDPVGAPFALLHVPGMDGTGIAARFAAHGVAVGAGTDFLAPASTVRLSFAGVDEESAVRVAEIITEEFGRSFGFA